jgi:CubicO group peptidase (beta-lactamase class C family)
MVRLPALAGRAAWRAAAILALPTALAGAQQREPAPGFDAYVTGALATWHVPGAAIAIVRNDSLIYAKGYGVREIGKPGAVDERTIFAIGSSSKAFTAAAVAMLVDSNTVRLDGRVTDYLPGFQLYDNYATKELTVRDILSHRSGLARGELAWYGSAFDRDEIVRRVRFLEPTWSFRSQFGYQNIMFITAGQIVAHVGNTTWDDFIARRIFAPLGMTSSSTTIRGLSSQPDLATPHAEVNDTVRAIAWRNIDNAGPAGSINSNVIDMAQWVRLQLGQGTYAGKALISKRMTDEMHTPQTVIRLDGAARATNPDTHLSAYGLGWFLEDYAGKLVVHHGGNIDGFTALVGMLPEEKLGVVILTNMNGTALPQALMHRIFDIQLKRPAKDWSLITRKRLDSLQAQARQQVATRAPAHVMGTKPSLALSAYAGTYADSLYGTLTIAETNGKLMLTFGPTWRGELEHWHYDTFRVRFDTPVLPPVMVQFALDPQAKVSQVSLDMAGLATFKRVPERPTPRAAGSQ